MSELLLELFCEEIPAMMQGKAAIVYKDIFAKYFTKSEIAFENIDVYVGPRRLTIHASGLPIALPASVKEIKGPNSSSPAAAIEGFCRSNKITKDDLVLKEIKNSEFFIYEQKILEQNIREILLKTLQEPISEYVWPKSMYWGDYKIKWVRPLQNILCIFDGETVPFEYGHLVANDKCFGHRFMSPESVSVKDFADYKQKLADKFIVLDANQRKEYIRKESLEAVLDLGLVIKDDEALLEEVTGLAEYPQVLVGKIDKKFLSVPSEILVSSMRAHQKYFSVFDKGGNFAPYFLFVSNIISTDKDIVISGNEKVLSARLADALYFYNQDLKTSMFEKAEKLNKVIFHAKLGSLKEKTLRLLELVRFIDDKATSAAEAALLCKSDIVSEVVDEFPTLQGIMGYYYAKSESVSEDAAAAIRDHYKPQGPNDICPKGDAAILALADKIDSLCGLMLAGEKPSGSKDPFAIRRQALGILRIILENNLSVNLGNLVTFSMNEFKDKIEVTADHKKQILSFLEDRLKHFFKSEYDSSLITSVLDLELESDILEIQNKLIAIKEFLANKDGDDLLAAYKRASNILGAKRVEGKLDESAFVSEHESALSKAIDACADKISVALESKDYSEGLKQLASLKKPLSSFFDNVMVKDEDASIAKNRMLLLEKTRKVFDNIAKFDRL